MRIINRILQTIQILILCELPSLAQTKMFQSWQSSLVEITTEGQLVYHADEQGNTLPDFSRVGYHHGDKSIPSYPTDKVLYPLENQDNSPQIQKAIDEIANLPLDKNGHRGTILLKRGTYLLYGTLHINASGIILKGEGDNINETRLLAMSKKKHNMIEITGTGQRTEIKGTRTYITDSFVPIGTQSFQVASTENYKPGDRIIVFRPGTREWIHDIKMDQIKERKGTRQWTPKGYDFYFEREIVKIINQRIYIDNPIVMQMEKKYGGGEIFRYTFDGRISEVGIENMSLESEFENSEDNAHGWIGIQFNKTENCWVRNVTCRHMGYAAISCESMAKNITVRDCRCLEPKSTITGGFRYSFNNCGQQNLFMNCHSTEGRHDYVTGARVCGPNVFYNCTATQTYADIGPHHRWSMGTLYDNVITDGDINIQDRGQMGSGHGWAGVTQVLWNCRARKVAVQKPWTSGQNYSIGTKAQKYPGHFKDRPDGYWEGTNKSNLFPRSLYIAQLMARTKKLDLKILTK